MKYDVIWTAKFKKDYKKAIKRNFDISELDGIITRLANDEPLDKSCDDHALKGIWSGFRECHIGFDWVLVYLKDSGVLTLTLIRTGTHTDVFGW